MNILHLATQDDSGGGGGFTAAYRLHQNMKGNGLASRMLVSRRNSGDPDVKLIPPEPYSWGDELVELFKRRFKQNGRKKRLVADSRYYFRGRQESKPEYSSEYLISYINHTPEAIIINWIQGFITAKNIFDLTVAFGCPVFWYMMDNAPMTGGCHYFWDCAGYQKACGNCPALHEPDEQDLSRRNMQTKIRWLDHAPIIPVMPTKWQLDRLEQSRLFGKKKHEKVFLSVDPELFKPVPKKAAKEVMGISPDFRVLFFGAGNLHAPNKGMKLLKEALSIIKKEVPDDVLDKVLFIYAGKGEALFQDVDGIRMHYLGELGDDRSLALAYQAADGFVCPSVEDGGPMMINESLMCGTPVIAFNNGIACEVVETGETGVRCSEKTAEALAEGITEYLNLDQARLQKMSEGARSVALELFHPDRQVQQFTELIRKYSAPENVSS